MFELISAVSIIIFVVFIIFNLLIMLFISSYLAAVIMLLIPVLFIIILPDISFEFFAYEQARFLDGMVTINNLHVLLFIWSTLLGIIIYTEVISWYISGKSLKFKFGKSKETSEDTSNEVSEDKKEKKSKKKKKKSKIQQMNQKQVKIPFKPLERFLMKLEEIIGGGK